MVEAISFEDAQLKASVLFKAKKPFQIFVCLEDQEEQDRYMETYAKDKK